MVLRDQKPAAAMTPGRTFPAGIRREPGRGYVVEVRVRPFPKERKRFPLGTPIADMRAWREYQRAAMVMARSAHPMAGPSALLARARQLETLVARVVVGLERLAAALEAEGRIQ